MYLNNEEPDQTAQAVQSSRFLPSDYKMYVFLHTAVLDNRTHTSLDRVSHEDIHMLSMIFVLAIFTTSSVKIITKLTS